MLEQLSRVGLPSILISYLSAFHLPDWMDGLEIGASQLLSTSYLAQYFPVSYYDFEPAVGRPKSSAQIKRLERKVRDSLKYLPDWPNDSDRKQS